MYIYIKKILSPMLQLRVFSTSTMCARPSINRCSFSANDDGVVCTYRVCLDFRWQTTRISSVLCARGKEKIKETNCLFFRLCRRK